jgi:hypothetical protein
MCSIFIGKEQRDANHDWQCAKGIEAIKIKEAKEAKE